MDFYMAFYSIVPFDAENGVIYIEVINTHTIKGELQRIIGIRDKETGRIESFIDREDFCAPFWGQRYYALGSFSLHLGNLQREVDKRCFCKKETDADKEYSE